MLRKTEWNIVALTLACAFVLHAQSQTATLVNQASSIPSANSRNPDREPPAVYKFATLIAPFPGATATYPSSINDRRRIVRTYQNASGSHGFVWKRGVFTAVDPPFPGTFYTTLFDINLQGQIVGSYETPGRVHGLLINRGVFTPIDVPAAGTLSLKGADSLFPLTRLFPVPLKQAS